MSGDSPTLPDELIDQILRGQPIDIRAPREAHLLAEWVETLRRPARPSELRGAPLAVAAFRWAKSPSARLISRPRRLRIPMRVVIAGAAAVLGALGAGVAVAAATGSLPAPLQAVAHVLFGAPAPSAGNADGHSPADSTGVIESPAEFPPPVPGHQPPVGTSTPGASPETASGQADVTTEPSGLAPEETDTHSTAGQQWATRSATPSEQPESTSSPAADATPKHERPADVERPTSASTPRRERSGGPPVDVEPKGAPPAPAERPGGPVTEVEPQDEAQKPAGGPPADVEPLTAPPERPKSPASSLADAADLSHDPMQKVEHPGEE
jgi:hypothetical protein